MQVKKIFFAFFAEYCFALCFQGFQPDIIAFCTEHKKNIPQNTKISH